MLKYFETKQKEDCYGCGACIAVCHSEAIAFVRDAEGFSYPGLDSSKCTECRLCKSVCPVGHENELTSETFIQECFAAKAREHTILNTSSSGGIFSVIANLVLDQKGKVYGAAYDQNWNVFHRGIEHSNDLEQLKVSKYVQSYTAEIFKEVRKDLAEGRFVYFTGTPCQVASLKRFLRGKTEKLLTSDLVCHGVPSALIWQSYLESLNEKKISNLKMRNVSYWGVHLEYYRSLKRKVTKHSSLSPYLFAFLNNYLHRPVCYQCSFAREDRVGDITLGDYWGGEKFHPELLFKYGVSLVLINTNKGKDFFNKISSQIVYTQSRREWAIQENQNLVKPSSRPIQRNSIYADALTMPFKQLTKKYMYPDDYFRLFVSYNLKMWLKNILARVGFKRFK